MVGHASDRSFGEDAHIFARQSRRDGMTPPHYLPNHAATDALGMITRAREHVQNAQTVMVRTKQAYRTSFSC
jgi:hypothetical protein